MSFFKRILDNTKKSLSVGIKWKLRRIIYYGKQQYCNVCNSHIKKFIAGGIVNPVFEQYEIIGGGYHESDVCPVCRSSYRQRLIKLFLDEEKIINPGLRILHAAPEECLHYLLNKRNMHYTCGDIQPERYSYYAKPVFLDLTNIPFADNSFELILCSHILEHIPDDDKAMSELFRVLAPGGTAILQVPISAKLEKTYEDFSIQSEEKRFEKFGQHDHVRIYGQDYIERLEKAGFEVTVIPSLHYSTFKDFDKMMLDEKEKLFIGRKE